MKRTTGSTAKTGKIPTRPRVDPRAAHRTAEIESAVTAVVPAGMSNESKGKGSRPTQEPEDLPDSDDSLPPLDFTTFVLSLSSTVLASLGEIPDQDGTHSSPNLALARQTIDLLDLLQHKTKGNLTGEEERLLDRMLLDLRMKFVEVAGRKK